MTSLLNTLSNIQWQQPWWFLLALQPLLLWLAIQWLKSRQQQNFVEKHLLAWLKVAQIKTLWQKIFSRDLAYALAWLGFGLAMAGPRIPDSQNADVSNSRHDVMLVMDLSRSMYATDIQPSRLRRSVLEAYEFLSMAKSMRVGVVVYAARAHLYVPITYDYRALEFYLKDLDSMQMPTQGSNYIAAIKFAQAELNKQRGHSKSIVWMTDADLGADAEAHKELQQILGDANIRTHSLVLATADAVSIPLKNGKWLENDGKGVISTSNMPFLEKSIKSGGGAITIVSENEADWRHIYQQGLLKDREKAQQPLNEGSEQWQALYMWFLFPAVLLFFAAYFPSIKALLLFIILSSLMGFGFVNADGLYLDKIHQGEAMYQSQDYAQAKRHFIQAVLEATTDSKRAMALHNLGNALFQMGDYEGAATLFEDGLRYNSKQQASINNRQLSQELYSILLKRLSKMPMTGSGTQNNDPLQSENETSSPSSLVLKKSATEFKLPKIPQPERDRLVEKGLAHIQLLDASAAQTKARKKAEHELDNARLYFSALGEQTNTSANPLWKRMFEIEEGFPASLDKTKQVPGVQPW